MSPQVPLKQRALSSERIARAGREMHTACPVLAAAFSAQVVANLLGLELRARTARTAQGPHQRPPLTGQAALDTVLRSRPAVPEAASAEVDFRLCATHMIKAESR